MRRVLFIFGWLAFAAAPALADPAVTAGGGAGAAGRLDGLLGGFALGRERGPVRIDAGAMEFDYKTRVLTYRGSVSVTQGDLKLRSDTLRITLDPDKPERPREIVAEGDVRIDQGARRATGARAVFDDAAKTVTLSGRARLQDGPNEVAGERVVVYLDQQRSVVEGGPERVRAVLYPSSMKADLDAVPGSAATPNAGGDER